MLKIEGNSLFCGNLALDFPAVRLSIGGTVFAPSGKGRAAGALSRTYLVNGLEITVSVQPLMKKGGWRKHVVIRAMHSFPTPDWVELERQTIPDPSVIQCGYRATKVMEEPSNSEEDGSGLGVIPGCGYPLVGTHFFAGAEHPAAFAEIKKKTKKTIHFSLVQHPVWNEDGVLELSDAVCGWFDDAKQSFREYLNSVRFPARTAPFFVCGTFWSDPYLGNLTYSGEPESYRSFINAFADSGIIPDTFLLDAGWQDRESILQPKPCFHGIGGIQKLLEHAKQKKSSLSLWVSHNGPMCMAPEYLKSSGFQIGQGNSSSYGGKMDFGVLLDPKLEKAVGDALVRYAQMGIRHFKIDWDNDCAVNRKFKKKYPTQDHVREGSINAMLRIVKRVRKEQPDILLRNGWWPSPWWLMHVNHIFLADSNDSEYTFFPSRTQKDSAATYRDTMYYCIFQRDHSAVPLEAIDNHEFSHALRNPFHEESGTAADLMMLAVMRGTSYIPLTLQPEAMEPWYAEFLAKVMQFARKYGSNFYSAKASMIGGNPNAGKIYGFRYEQRDHSVWEILRNPSPQSQTFVLEEDLGACVMVYPFFAQCTPSAPLDFAPHEVKIFVLSRKKLSLPFQTPFQITNVNHFRFPAHLQEKTVGPSIGENYRINEIQYEISKKAKTDNGVEIMFRLRLPYRMRRTTINIAVPAHVDVTARLSRNAYDKFSCCQLPVTRYDAGLPGIGEGKNPDVVVPVKENFFSVPCAEGGEAWYSLFFIGISNWQPVRLSISGFFAPSGKYLQRSWHPSWLPVFPPAHPDGFPVTKNIVIN